jgi:hypothetical protein
MFRAGNPWGRGKGTMSADRRMLLGSLLTNPARISEVPPDEAAALMGDLAGVQTALAAHMAAAQAQRERPCGRAPEDRLLAPEETAELLGVKVRWLYRHAGKLPFTVRLSRKVLRFSEVGVRRFMAKRGLAGAGTL